MPASFAWELHYALKCNIHTFLSREFLLDLLQVGFHLTTAAVPAPNGVNIQNQLMCVEQSIVKIS